jgi:hypothetical protein
VTGKGSDQKVLVSIWLGGEQEESFIDHVVRRGEEVMKAF